MATCTDFNITAGFTGSQPRFQPTALNTILIANRGEIALRLIRTCKALGLRTVAIYTTPDTGTPHTLAADVSVHLPGKEAEGKGYLDKHAILEACTRYHVQAVLPGYGFLSENDAFATLLEEKGILLCGPRAQTMRDFGLKHHARQLAQTAGVPCVPGTGLLHSAHDALAAAEDIGYPVMLKSSAGGGGMGLQVCRDAAHLQSAYATVTSRAQALFGSPQVFLEKYIQQGRHIEVQIFGNGMGHCVSFHERECSIQRRNQKVIEEAPSLFVSRRAGFRRKLSDAATRLGSLVNYKSAGTVEMLVDDATGDFYFLECNVRLQVEHPVTEMTHDVDLVALMLFQAEMEACGQAGIPAAQLDGLTASEPKGWAIEARLYAEDPIRDYAPSPGLLQNVAFAPVQGTRIDTWVKTGLTVTSSYDPLLAKVIASGQSREQAVERMQQLLTASKVQGSPTNLELLQQIVAADAFKTGQTLTSFLSSPVFTYQPCAIEVVSPGLATSVQAFPGRRGILHGVPEAGPTDSLSFRIANRLVGNPDTMEGLEMTMMGPTLLFHAPAVVAVVGAEMELQVDGQVAPPWTRLAIQAGSRLSVGAVKNGSAGMKAYLAVRGGLPGVADWIGSKASSPAIGVGGYQGRNLLPGDTLAIERVDTKGVATLEVPPEYRWTSGRTSGQWELFAMPGPFDDDEFLTADDRDKLYRKPWKVSPQAARSGIRFDAPQLQWARSDGGEGGSHPSNMLEFGYSPLGINWNGNTPVLLGVDGPDLGGLLISHCVLSSDWRAGQLVPGDKVRFRAVTFEQAKALLLETEAYLASISTFVETQSATSLRAFAYDEAVQPPSSPPSCLLHAIEATSTRPRVEFRAGGDRTIVVCYGPPTADTINRARIELLQRELQRVQSQAGITAFSPNLRTLTIYFDLHRTDPGALVRLCTAIDDELPPAHEVKLKVRTWTFPVVIDDDAVVEAIQRYKATVRNKAVYLEGEDSSDNKPYLARCNGLPSTRDIERSITDTLYLTASVGFFFGTPILFPLDPRLRLRSAKFNPTRTYTPMGALGHGGSCWAIYGADSPGGYPIVARTLPGWRTFGDVPPFRPEQPWLLSDFDFVRFVPVSKDEYAATLASFLAGTYTFHVEDTEFDVAAQLRFLASVRDEAQDIALRQAAASEACRREEEVLFAEWKAGQGAAAGGTSAGAGTAAERAYDEADPATVTIKATLAGSVWKVPVREGDTLRGEQVAVVLEAMKSEVALCAPCGFEVKAILKLPGSHVAPGDVVLFGRRV